MAVRAPRTTARQRAQSAFTLLETIVVLAIVSVAFALTLAAVQQARDAAARAARRCGARLIAITDTGAAPSNLLGEGVGTTDEEMHHAFLRRQDQDAFAALVGRHVPLVLNVCRRVLHHQDDRVVEARIADLSRGHQELPGERIAARLRLGFRQRRSAGHGRGKNHAEQQKYAFESHRGHEAHVRRQNRAAHR